MKEFDLIYLTGAPASGKSSMAKALAERVKPLEVWEFGDRLTQHMLKRFPGLVQEDLRKNSAKLIEPDDVKHVDRNLIEWSKETRLKSHIIIDSHPVTKESYGFRVTPYSLNDFAILNPTRIWVLYCSPETTQQRISRDAGGRPLVSTEEARMHTQLQSSVALTYGMSIGIPVYMFDSARQFDELANELASRLQ